MSFKKAGIYPPNPGTTRGTATKLSSSKDKVVYTTGRTVIVSFDVLPFDDKELFSSFRPYAVDTRFEGEGQIALIRTVHA